MKIVATEISLAASHRAVVQDSRSETVRVWNPARRPEPEAHNLPPPSSQVQISQAAQQAGAADADSDELARDPLWNMIKDLIERMTGQKIKIYRPDCNACKPAPAQLAALPPTGGLRVEIDRTVTHSETEHTQFQAQGEVKTADGRTISFQIGFDLQRSYSEQSSTHVRLGGGKQVDPLVLNFSGTAAQLTAQKFAFDLNSDGHAEQISFVSGGGFLALDKNGDGKIGNGQELFGPASGDGMRELAAYDGDGNHWIDENDAVYQRLQVLTKDSAGHDRLQSLTDAGVGALYLGAAGTPFALKTAQNQSLGQISSSGVWLSEDGQAHSLQQVDLTV